MSESVHVFVLRSAHWVDTGRQLLRVGVCPIPTLPSVPSHIPPNGPKLPVGGKTSVQRINKIMGRAVPLSFSPSLEVRMHPDPEGGRGQWMRRFVLRSEVDGGRYTTSGNVWARHATCLIQSPNPNPSLVILGFSLPPSSPRFLSQVRRNSANRPGKSCAHFLLGALMDHNYLSALPQTKVRHVNEIMFVITCLLLLHHPGEGKGGPFFLSFRRAILQISTLQGHRP